MRAHMPPYSNQAPTGAYRAPAEIPEAERKLRTALAYVNHARDLIRDALGDNEPKAQREAKIAYDVASDKAEPERVPKWDPAWAEAQKDPVSAYFEQVERTATNLRAALNISQPPNCLHPMHAETIRDHDERLAGGEDRL